MKLSWNTTHSKWRKFYRGRQWQSKKCNKSDDAFRRQCLVECAAWKKTVDEKLSADDDIKRVGEVVERAQQQAIQKWVELKQLSDKFVGRLPPKVANGVQTLLATQLTTDNPATIDYGPQLPLIEPFAVQGLQALTLDDRTIDQSRVISVCQKEFIGLLECDPMRIYNLKYQTQKFVDWFGDNTTDAINADTLTNYRRHLLDTYGQNTAKDYFLTFKQFLNWCFEQERIDALPRNFRSKKLAITTKVNTIELWTKEQIKIIDTMPEVFRLYLLLMLNCGAYQSDLSDLTENEVDWKEGRIIRKRSKTQDHEGVPTVNFKLWPEVFTLLKKHRAETVVNNEDGERLVLLSSNGTTLISGRTDNIRKPVDRWCKKNNIELPPLKCLRKTGAAALDDKFGRNYARHYLAHALVSQEDRSYLPPPPQAKFDESIAWLRSELLD